MCIRDSLKTDSSFIVGTLTPGRVVLTDPTSNQLISSTTTNAELNFLSGITSNVQTQINSKVSKAGDTMTGPLQLPAGTVGAPSLNFGSPTTGLFASAANTLSFGTNSTERMKIDAGGTIFFDLFTTPGVIHNGPTGNLTSSLIVDADIVPGANIANTKLATIAAPLLVSNSATTATTLTTAGTIVLRDGTGGIEATAVTAPLITTTTVNATTVNATTVNATNLTGITGAITLPTGTAALPSLNFAGSTGTGLSVPRCV